MLLEGVLTESVREEKLYVSFTVEGYFHFIIGDVLFQQNLNSLDLKQIIENNKLNGISGGLEQCLIRDIQKQEYSRLFELIDFGGKSLESCNLPLAFAFNFQPLRNNEISDEELKEIHVEAIIQDLISNFTINDILVLKKSIELLHDLQKIKTVKIIYQKIFKYLKPIDEESLKLYIRSIQYIEKQQINEAFKTVEDCLANYQYANISEIYMRIAFQYQRLGNFEKALYYLMNIENSFSTGSQKSMADKAKLFKAYSHIYFSQKEYEKSKQYVNDSIKLKLNIDKNDTSIGSDYVNLATVLMYLGELTESEKVFQKAFDIQSKKYGLSHSSITNYYSNIAVLYSKKRDFKMAKLMYENSLKLRITLYGKFHEKVAINYNGLGVALGQLGDIENAMSYLQKALDIQIAIYGEVHPDVALTYKNMGMGYYFNNLNEEASNFLQIAHRIYSELFSKEHRTVKEIQRILDDIARK
jgi:tetratricopeptide (TPR) repeat protein